MPHRLLIENKSLLSISFGVYTTHGELHFYHSATVDGPLIGHDNEEILEGKGVVLALSWQYFVSYQCFCFGFGEPREGPATVSKEGIILRMPGSRVRSILSNKNQSDRSVSQDGWPMKIDR